MLPALIYGLITGTMGFAVRAGTSEAIRTIEAATASDTENSNDSKDDSNYAGNTDWQAINNDYLWTYDYDNHNSENQTLEEGRHWKEVIRKKTLDSY